MTTALLQEPCDAQPQPAAQPEAARVLHVVNGEHYAGAERVQDLLALRLPAQGFEVAFACLKPERFPALRRSQSSPLYEVPMRAKFDLWPAYALAELVREEGFALIHTHTARSALVGALAARWAGVPMVHHLHSPTVADTTHRVRNWLNATTERYSVRRATTVVTVSESLALYAHDRRLNRNAPVVVPNGVPTAGPLALRRTPTGRWTLGMIALFRPRKGLEVLLAALATLKQRGHDLRLRAVGGFETPEYEAAIHAEAERLGVAENIEWRGFQKNVDAELAAMDLFVLPSLFGEGMPMVMLEAMAAGVPVIGTRVEGTPEVVRDGLDGLIAEPRDPASLAAAIERCLTGQADWQALCHSAYERQTTRFSDSSMARGVAEVYRAVLGS